MVVKDPLSPCWESGVRKNFPIATLGAFRQCESAEVYVRSTVRTPRSYRTNVPVLYLAVLLTFAAAASAIPKTSIETAAIASQ